MRQIIGLFIVALVVSFYSLSFAATIVVREGNDVVEYKHFEIQRLKNVPQGVPERAAIWVADEADRAEYVLPEQQSDSASWKLDFPVVKTITVSSTHAQYREGLWEKAVVTGSPSIVICWGYTLGMLMFPLCVIFVIGLVNQKETVGGIKLIVPYGMILTAPMIGYSVHLGVHGLLSFVLVVIWTILTAFTIFVSCEGSGGLIQGLVGFIGILAVLLVSLSGAGTSGDVTFLAHQFLFLFGASAACYLLAKLANRLFFKPKAGFPTPAEFHN